MFRKILSENEEKGEIKESARLHYILIEMKLTPLLLRVWEMFL